MDRLKIYPAGDQALVAEFGNVISEQLNRKVLLLKNCLVRKKIEGITEFLPTYRSLMIFYDDRRISYKKLRKIVKSCRINEETTENEDAKRIYIPCCYHREFGLDLQNMSEYLKLSEQEIINIHSKQDYKIYMLGFLPGFVYLGGLDPRIYMPRLDAPRTAIPTRSVGIGGNQTGVYPVSSPGGWQIIGRTPIDFYQPQNKNPILCHAGDYIRFVPIGKDEYKDIRRRVETGEYIPETEIVN